LHASLSGAIFAERVPSPRRNGQADDGGSRERGGGVRLDQLGAAMERGD
jgi:hypothetical protein